MHTCRQGSWAAAALPEYRDPPSSVTKSDGTSLCISPGPINSPPATYEDVLANTVVHRELAGSAGFAERVKETEGGGHRAISGYRYKEPSRQGS